MVRTCIRSIITRPWSRRGAALAGIVVTASLQPRMAHAELLDITFTGHVTEVTPAVSSVFTLGDPMSIVYTYDSNAAPEPSLILTQAVYIGAISGAEFSVGSYSGSASAGNINLTDDDPAFHDRVTFRGLGLNSPAIGVHVPVGFTVLLEDPSDAALSSLALPLSVSDLAGFSSPGWQLLFTPIPLSGDPVAAVGGVVTSIEITTSTGVPEPDTLLLCAAGLAGIASARRRRR